MLQKLVGLSVVGVMLTVAARADLTPHDPHFGDGVPAIRASVVAEPFGGYVADLRGVGSPVVAWDRFVRIDASGAAGLFSTSIQHVLLDEYSRLGRTHEWTYFGAAGADGHLSRFEPSWGGDEWGPLESGGWSFPVAADDWHCEIESKSVSPVPAPAAVALGAIGIGLVARAKRRLL